MDISQRNNNYYNCSQYTVIWSRISTFRTHFEKLSGLFFPRQQSSSHANSAESGSLQVQALYDFTPGESQTQYIYDISSIRAESVMGLDV